MARDWTWRSISSKRLPPDPALCEQSFGTNGGAFFRVLSEDFAVTTQTMIAVLDIVLRSLPSDTWRSRMSQFPIAKTSDPYLESRTHPPTERQHLAWLIGELKAKRQEIEQDRNELRLTMSAVESELIQLTNQQAELQKLQVAIDRLLKYLNDQTGGNPLAPPHSTGLADAAVPGTA